MTEEHRKKLIDRIVKLFRLGEHVATDGQKGTTEAEMMMAVTKARQLMIDHAVTMAEVEAAKGGDIRARMDERIRFYGTYMRAGKLAQYDWGVAFAVGVLTDTRVYRQRGQAWGRLGINQTEGVAFVGDEDDVAVADQLFMIWLKDVRRLARVAYGGGNTWGVKHTSYAVGLASRIAQRARDMTASSSVALVLRSKQEAIDRWHARNMTPSEEESGKKEKKVRAPKYDSEALHRGYRDGENFNMATKVIKEGA